MRIALFLLTLSIGSGAQGLLAQATTKQEREDVLNYGIESEVLDLVKSLRSEKTSDYQDLLAVAFSKANSDELKQEILLLFSELKDARLAGVALKELSDPDNKSNSYLLNLVTYVTDLKSDGAKDVFSTLVTGKNKVLAVAAIRSLGKLGATDKVDELVQFYDDAETDPNFKPDLVWSFGEMKATQAVDLLLREYDDNESQPLLRRSILEALGKIGDPKAWPTVESALKDTNTDVRSAAVAALGAFSGQGDLDTLLTSALRDSQVNVRIAGAQAAATAKLDSLKGLLGYRLRKDPDPKVRVEALRARAAYADGPAEVLSVLGDRKSDQTVWREALRLALDNKYPDALSVLKTVVEADNKDKNGGFAGIISGAIVPQKDVYRTLLGLILQSPQIPARASALRTIGIARFTEYQDVIKTLSDKDPDVGIRNQAKKILTDWGSTTPVTSN